MEIPSEQINWLNFNVTKFGFDVDQDLDTNGFNFEASFDSIDAGQYQETPQLIDETELIRALRTEEAKRKAFPAVSPEIFKYYDGCVDFFYNDHMKLLSEHLNIVDRIQKTGPSQQRSQTDGSL